MNVKSGYGKSPAVGINNVQLTNPSNVDIDSPDGGEPKKSLRTAFRQNFPQHSMPFGPSPHYPHKLNSEGNCSETWWYEDLMFVFYTVCCIIFGLIALGWGASEVGVNEKRKNDSIVVMIIFFSVGLLLLLRIKLYKVKFIYITRTCEISYFRFPGNCFFPSRQCRISFDDIAYAKPYLLKTCAYERLRLDSNYYYVSFVLNNNTSVRVTRYGQWKAIAERSNWTLESVAEPCINSLNKFIKNVLHNKELQIEAEAKKREDIVIKELW
jgi:hypothetical protein